MATIVKERVPTTPSREVPNIGQRRLTRWMPAVIGALVIGLVAGAAGWQTTRSDATASNTTLAQKYIAAGMMTPGQAAMFASNAKVVDLGEGLVMYGHPGSVVPKAVRSDPRYVGTIDGVMAARHSQTQIRWTGKERLVFAGPDGFVTEWTSKGFSSLTGKNFTVPGVSVSTVKNGKIILQKTYYDPAPLFGPATK